MSAMDARGMAWMAAQSRLEAAQKIAVDHKGKLLEPLPEWYWALVGQAEVWARLAQVSANVGLSAGDWIVEQEKREERQRTYFEEMLAKREATS